MKVAASSYTVSIGMPTTRECFKYYLASKKAPANPGISSKRILGSLLRERLILCLPRILGSAATYCFLEAP